MLEPLKNIKQNAKINITDFNNIYTYRAQYKNIVDEKNVELLGQTDKPIATLFRCVGENGTNDRLVVQAKLVKSKSYGHYRQLKKHKPKLPHVKQLNGFDQTTINVAKALYLTGSFKKDWFQYFIALLPVIIVSVIYINKKRKYNNYKN